MRCPKCHYLSFDPDPRCRNCGYDLDIDTPETGEADKLDLKILPVAVPPAAAPDLPLRGISIGTDAAAALRPVALELARAVPSGLVRETAPAKVEPALVLVGVAAESAPATVIRRTPVRSAPPTTELPLFVKTMGPQELSAFGGLVDTAAVDDESTETDVAAASNRIEAFDVDLEPAPPVSVPPTARPLSVRRPVAEPARAPAPRRRPGPLDHDLLEDLQRIEREEGLRPDRRPAAAAIRGSRLSDERSESGEPAGHDEMAWTTGDVAVSHRMGAAAVDGLLLGGVGAFVLWATLKVADVSPSALGFSSLVPMAVFLASVSVAYLLMFTAAGGQTVGKMLTGIRVVGEDSNDERVTIGQAASRAVLAPLSLMLLGLGWLPALIGRGPALHDRLSHTRVVRA